MEENLYLSIINNKQKQEIAKIRDCNEYTQKYGIVLSEKEITSLAEKRVESLKATNRIEFGEWIIDKMIKEFCDSQYIQKDEFVDTINALIEMFYYFKNETKDLVADDDLIKFMKKAFEGVCQGSLEYLEGTVLEKMVDNVLRRKPLDYKLEDTDTESEDMYE